MTRKSTRREFVKTSAALGTAFWVGGQTSSAKQDSPMQRLNIACIGAQGKGSSDTSNADKQGAHVVALCDIDEDRLNKKAVEIGELNSKSGLAAPAKFVDYREMLDKIADDIDAVTVSTPDHSHAPASVLAMKKGKHVYCQKPLTWSIAEARTMRETAKSTGVVTQMGNQGTSENGLREAVEVIKSGGIGKVQEVHIWTNRPIWPQGEGRPTKKDPVPAGLHWDLFLGPAPERPYVHDVYTPFKWRGWLDFGTGALGDMACHTANMAVMACDLFEPTAFQAVKNSGIVDNETYPSSSVIEFDFPQRGDMPACKVYWYDGGELPGEDVLPNDILPESFRKRVEKGGRVKAMSSGSLIVGSEGKVFSPNDYGAQYFLLPEAKYADYKKPDPWLPRVELASDVDQRHMSEFIAAIRGEGKTMSNFEYAGRLTETILCGNLALRSNKRIEWNAESMVCTNNAALNKYVRREYREGWTL